jgi:hypothetical protein
VIDPEFNLVCDLIQNQSVSEICLEKLSSTPKLNSGSNAVQHIANDLSKCTSKIWLTILKAAGVNLLRGDEKHLETYLRLYVHHYRAFNSATSTETISSQHVVTQSGLYALRLVQVNGRIGYDSRLVRFSMTLFLHLDILQII